MTELFGLPKKCITDIRAVFKQFSAVERVLIFGSRAIGNYKPGSDVDLALLGKGISYDDLLKIKARLDDIPWVYMYDVVIYDKISNPAVQAHIDDFGLNFYEKKERMAENWVKIRLGDNDNCLKIGSGATPRGGQENYKTEGISLIRSQNVLDFTFSKSGLAFIDENQAKELSNVEVEEGDVLLNITGDSVARVCQVPKDVLPARVNQHVAIIRPNGDVLDSAFLKYYLLNPATKELLLGLSSSGATRNALTKVMIENFEIIAPEDIPTQHRIAAILTALDDKIELNRRMNETLKGIAQAVWGEWFGKYASGEEELPEGTGKTNFEEHLDVERGLSYKGEGLVGPDDGGIPMYNLNSVLEGGGFKYSGMKYYSGEYRERHLVNPGELIVTNTEQGHKYLLIGYPAVVPKMFGPGICSHHIYRVRPKPDSYLTSQFFYYLMMHPIIREQIVGCANGTTVNMLKIDGLKVPIFLLPPQKIVADFSVLAQRIWDKQEENNLHSRTLTNLRDALLPRLMRGEVEV